MRFWIWRSAVAQSDTAEKNPLRLLVRTNLFIPSYFWTTCTKFDSCCRHYIAICEKNLYRCTPTFLALKYCGGIFWKPLSVIWTKWGAQTFLPIFGLFAIFDHNFAKIVATRGDGNGLSSESERAIYSQKRWKIEWKLTHNLTQCLFKAYPSNTQRDGLGVREKNKLETKSIIPRGTFHTDKI